MKRVLFTPGPTQVPSEVLEAMARPLIHHRTDEYRALFLEATRLLAEHLGTKQPVLTLSCSGSGAIPFGPSTSRFANVSCSFIRFNALVLSRVLSTYCFCA